jgi:hypothetical protein
MKKLLIIVLLFGLNANAACDWSTGITPGPNKTFIYTEECHQAVGALVQSNKDLTAAIKLKDLAIDMSDKRVALWQTTADSEQQRLSTIESDQKKSDWTMFALGVATTFLATYGAAQIIHR